MHPTFDTDGEEDGFGEPGFNQNSQRVQGEEGLIDY